jgi:RHS repeat-associated protein
MTPTVAPSIASMEQRSKSTVSFVALSEESRGHHTRRRTLCMSTHAAFAVVRAPHATLRVDALDAERCLFTIRPQHTQHPRHASDNPSMPTVADLLQLARESTSPPLLPFEQRLERDIAQPIIQAVQAAEEVSGRVEAPASEASESTTTHVLHRVSQATQTLATGLSLVSAVGELPLTMIDTATAVISNALIPPGLGFSALPAGLGMHLGPPHGHVHPPSLIPPAPVPIPLPSMGMVMGFGCVSVFIGGMPAIRTGDFGFALTCGSLGPTFEIITGSASVYVGGKRAARLGDLTRICNPLSADAVASAMQGAMAGMAVASTLLPIVNDMVSSLHTTSQSADSSAAAAEEADPNEAASLALDAVAQAADAAGQMQSALLAGAQAIADAASFAATALVGVDPGIPPGIGITLGMPRPVLIGGFPLPPSQVISNAVSNALRRLRARRRRVTESFSEFRERARAARDGDGGGGGHHREGEEEHGDAVERHPEVNGTRECRSDPVDVIRGAVLMSSLDCDLGGLLRFSRHYDTDQRGRVGACGRGVRHFYERELRVYLDRCVYVSETGVTITFPAFRGRNRLVRFGAVIERLRAESSRGMRYRVRYKGSDMIFVISGDAGNAQLVQLSGAEGQVLLAYSPTGLLESAESRQGGALLFQHDENGLLRTIESADVRARRITCRYSYDAHRRLVRAVDAAGAEEAYAYDDAHCLTTRWDAANYPFHWRYDDVQRCIWTSGHGGYLETAFEYKTGATLVTAPGEGTSTFHHNALGVLTRVEGPDGSVIEREIDAFQWCVSERDEAGRKVVWLYDETGDHVAREDRFGNRLPPSSIDTSFDAEPPALPAQLASQLGRAAVNALDVHVASGMDARMLALIPQPLQAFIAPAFQLRGDAPPPLGADALDALGQTTQHVTPRGASALSYDAVGNLVAVVDRDGANQALQYAHRTLLAQVTDGNGNAVQLRHTAAGQVARIADGLGSASEYVYTPAGRVERIVRHGRVWESYAYKRGVLAEKKDALGETLLTVEAHANALPKSIKLASGEAFRFDYDARGNTIEASSSKHDVRLRYDAHGKRIADRRDGRGITHRPLQGSTHTRVEHTFLERFRWSSTHAAYGPREVITLSLPSGEAIHIERHPGVAIRTCSGGARELLQFREDGHLVAQAIFHDTPSKGRWNATTQYARSNEGDILTVLDSARGERRFTMDGAHRLIAEHTPWTGKTTHYVLDAAGNLRASKHIASAEYAVGNLLIRADAETFTHDHRGRVAERTRDGKSIRYEYDSWDQLARVRDGAEDWHASYDGLGRRVSFGRGEKQTQLYWDGDRIAGEVQSHGRVRIYLYLDETSLIPIAFVDYAHQDAAPESGQLHHVFHDATGMPHHIERASGEVVWRALEIDAYGSVIVDPKSTIAYHLRWPGHRFDEDTGLHYNRYRDYDPKLGRYIEPDPLGHAGGINLYAYSKNPMVDVDLLGLRSLCERENDIRNAFLEATGRPLTESMELQLNGLITRLRANSGDIEADLALRRFSRDWRTEHEGGLPRTGGDPNAPRRAPGEALNGEDRTAAQEAHFRRRIGDADARGDLNGANQARYDRHLTTAENQGKTPLSPRAWQPIANNALSNGERGRAHENAVLRDLGIENNNYGSPETWPTPKGVDTRPDAVTDRSVIDVKSMPDEPPRRTYNDSDQLRGERDMAAQSGKAHVVILTNGNRDNVKPSEPLARPAEEPGGPQTTVYHRDHRGTWSLWNPDPESTGWVTIPRPNL